MNRFYDPSSESSEGEPAPPLAPLALLLLTYGSTLIAPRLLQELRGSFPGQFDWGIPALWAPTAAAAACAIGLALGIMMALSRMIRDLQSRPYATLGSALGALLGMALLALHAPFTFRDVDSSTLAVFCVAVSILGGVLMQTGGAGSALLGLLLSALPAAAVASWLWSTRPPGGGLRESLAECEVPNQAFLVLLALVGVLIPVMAVLARALHGRARVPDWQSAREVVRDSWPAVRNSWPAMRNSWPAARSALRNSLAWSRRLGDSMTGVAAFRTSLVAPGRAPAERSRFADARAGAAGAARRLKTLWNTKAGEAPPYGFSVWRYHDGEGDAEITPRDDADIETSLRKSSRVWPIVVGFALLVGAALSIGLWAARS